MLSVPISTGAAAGGCLASALVRGIYEVIERDAFMISYLNKLENDKVDLEKIPDARITTLLSILNRYRIEGHIMDITSDLGVPTFVTILVDRTGIGPAIHCGLKTSFLIMNCF